MSEKKFDLTVHKVDPKTARVISQNHYVLHIDNKGTRFERPPGSGEFFAPNGDILPESKSIVAEAAARAVVKPVSPAEAPAKAK